MPGKGRATPNGGQGWSHRRARFPCHRGTTCRSSTISMTIEIRVRVYTRVQWGITTVECDNVCE